MHPLLDSTLKLLTLRDGPQSLPHSPTLLTRLALLLLAVTALFMARLYSGPLIALHTVVSLALTFGLPLAALAAAGKQARAVQTATAICLAELVFILIDVAILAAYGTPPDKPEHATTLQQAVAFLWFVFLVAQVAVNAGIYRHALDWPPIAGIGLAILFAGIAITLGGLLPSTIEGASP